jgi:hypothetical protein
MRGNIAAFSKLTLYKLHPSFSIAAENRGRTLSGACAVAPYLGESVHWIERLYVE